MLNRPRSSVDRAVASGAMRTGSTPVGGTCISKCETEDGKFGREILRN